MKNKKGFTLVEVIVSVSLIMIVMLYLLRTIIVIGNKNNELTTLQEYSVYENNLLKKFYDDVSANLPESDLDGVTASEQSGNTVINLPDINKTLILNKSEDKITYDNIVYKLPDNVSFTEKEGKIYSFKHINSIYDNKTLVIIDIYVKVSGKDEMLKLMYSGQFKEWIVTFHANNAANETWTVGVPRGMELNEDDQPTNFTNGTMARDGGWYTESGQMISFPYEVTGDIDLYANWKNSAYEVVFDKNSSTAVCTVSGCIDGKMPTQSVALNSSGGSDKFQLIDNKYQNPGWTFIGWNTESDGSGTAMTIKNNKYMFPKLTPELVSQIINENGGKKKLYAIWIKKTYTVYYDGLGNTGGSTASSTHAYGTAKALTKNGFTRTGYKFAKWTNTKAWTSIPIAAEDNPYHFVSIESNVQPNVTYTITMANAQVTSGSASQFTTLIWDATSKQSLARVETAFGTNRTITITAPSTTNGSHDVQVLIYSGYASQTANVATTYTTVNLRTFSDSTIHYNDEQSVNNLTSTEGATVKLYALWTPITYKITYNGNGNTGGSTAQSTHTYGTAKALTSNGFTKTGHTFAGWATSATGDVVYSNAQSVSNLTTTDGATINLFAKWTPNNYAVALDKQGGDGGASGICERYATAYYQNCNLAKQMTTTANNISVPTKKGHTFGGYYTGKNGSGTQYINANGYLTSSASTTNFSASGTLYAKWTPKTYTITYKGHGGWATNPKTGEKYETWSEKVTYGTDYITWKNWYTPPTGKAFAGWTENCDGTGTDWTDWIGHVWEWDYERNVSLCAQWESNKYTITYNGNGNTDGKGTWSETAIYGKSYTTWDNWYTREGYTFIGWNEDKEGKGTDWTNYINKKWTWNYTKNVTLYAQWKKNPPVCTYSYINYYIHEDGDTCSENDRIYYNGSYWYLNGTKKDRGGTCKGYSSNGPCCEFVQKVCK